MKNISRVLIANRGEIAVRIIRACKSLGLETVAVVSEADRESLPARMADRSVCVGPPRAVDSYLNINLLVTSALVRGALNSGLSWKVRTYGWILIAFPDISFPLIMIL